MVFNWIHNSGIWIAILLLSFVFTIQVTAVENTQPVLLKKVESQELKKAMNRIEHFYQCLQGSGDDLNCEKTIASQSSTTWETIREIKAQFFDDWGTLKRDSRSFNQLGKSFVLKLSGSDFKNCPIHEIGIRTISGTPNINRRIIYFPIDQSETDAKTMINFSEMTINGIQVIDQESGAINRSRINKELESQQSPIKKFDDDFLVNSGVLSKIKDFYFPLFTNAIRYKFRSEIDVSKDDLVIIGMDLVNQFYSFTLSSSDPGKYPEILCNIAGTRNEEKAIWHFVLKNHGQFTGNLSRDLFLSEILREKYCIVHVSPMEKYRNQILGIEIQIRIPDKADSGTENHVSFPIMYDDFSKKIGISFYGITINGVPIAKSVNYQ